MNTRHRRSLRLDAFDYAEERAYFVTICAHDRGPIFGQVTYDTVRLSAIGEIARDCWYAIPQHLPFVELDAFVIMPNHIHGIIVISRVGARHALPEPRGQPAFGKPQSGSLGTIVGSYKSAVTKRANEWRTPVWQRNYHDHIIRDEGDLNAIRAYIDTNPARWAEDHEFALDKPEWNRPK